MLMVIVFRSFVVDGLCYDDLVHAPSLQLASLRHGAGSKIHSTDIGDKYRQRLYFSPLIIDFNINSIRGKHTCA